MLLIWSWSLHINIGSQLQIPAITVEGNDINARYRDETLTARAPGSYKVTMTFYGRLRMILSTRHRDYYVIKNYHLNTDECLQKRNPVGRIAASRSYSSTTSRLLIAFRHSAKNTDSMGENAITTRPSFLFHHQAN